MPLADRIIRFTATVVVLVVAGVAGYISYFHAVEVIERAGGQSAVAAHLLPATIDGLALCASLVMLFAARYGLPVPRLARVAVAMGIGATLSANLLHGIQHGPIASVIAAWPACALVVSYELCMWLVGAARQLSQVTTVTIEKPAEEGGSELAEVATILANEPKVSAAEIARRQSIPYAKALELTKEARALLAAA
jgi:hypothetical protein